MTSPVQLLLAPVDSLANGNMHWIWYHIFWQNSPLALQLVHVSRGKLPSKKRSSKSAVFFHFFIPLIYLEFKMYVAHWFITMMVDAPFCLHVLYCVFLSLPEFNENMMQLEVMKFFDLSEATDLLGIQIYRSLLQSGSLDPSPDISNTPDTPDIWSCAKVGSLPHRATARTLGALAAGQATLGCSPKDDE